MSTRRFFVEHLMFDDFRMEFVYVQCSLCILNKFSMLLSPGTYPVVSGPRLYRISRFGVEERFGTSPGPRHENEDLSAYMPAYKSKRGRARTSP